MSGSARITGLTDSRRPLGSSVYLTGACSPRINLAYARLARWAVKGRACGPVPMGNEFGFGLDR